MSLNTHKFLSLTLLFIYVVSFIGSTAHRNDFNLWIFIDGLVGGVVFSYYFFVVGLCSSDD